VVFGSLVFQVNTLFVKVLLAENTSGKKNYMISQKKNPKTQTAELKANLCLYERVFIPKILQDHNKFQDFLPALSENNTVRLKTSVNVL